MKRFVYSFLVAATLALLPDAADAQIGGLTGGGGSTGTATAIQNPLVVRRNGEQLENAQVLYVTAEDCADDAEFEFEVTYVSNVKVAELWVGVGSQDCRSEASRTRSVSAENPVCKLVGSTKEARTKLSISASARDLFSDWGEEDCNEDEKDQRYTVYFIPLDQETDIPNAMAYPPLTVGTYSTLTATFTLYTARPDAPMNIAPLDGESQLGVTFSIIQGSPPKTRYRTYFDWGTGGETCGSGALLAGELSPEEGNEITSITTTSGSALLKGLGSRGVAIGEQVAAAVVTVDPAGNESPLSDVVCVSRVQTDGFWDVCQRDPKCADEFNSCSLRAPGAGRASLVLLLLVGLAAMLVVRRRQV